jgi:hypothetical protein
MQRCSTGARGFELPHQGVSSVGERGHRLTERTPFLGEEQALAVKDANPRISTRTLHIELIMLGKLSIIGAVVHDPYNAVRSNGWRRH